MNTTRNGSPMPSLGRLTTTLATVLIAALLILPAPALASHNSIGAHATLAQSTEDILTPDVDPTEAPLFHPELDPPRDAPLDQTGQRYTDCMPAEDIDEDEHEQALRDGDACYVGFLDGRLLYMQFTQIFSVHRSEDLLYQANPHPGDEHCNAHDEDDAVEQATTSLERRDDPECAPETHDQHIPGYIGVDTSLLDAATTLVNETPSGNLNLPMLVTPYVFLFGDPHPDNPNQSSYLAGEGPFGPNPIESGHPIQDIEGACGERTEECRLLTPTDLNLYDGQTDDLEDSPRLCMFTDRFAYEHPRPDTHLCGSNGRPLDLFINETTQGGLGHLDGTPTWLSTLPGWYRASVIAPGGLAGHHAAKADAFVDDPVPESLHHELNKHDYGLPTTSNTSPGDARLPFTFAVNPTIPPPSANLDCLAPNILTDGTHGIHGTYKADAIDLDVYASPTNAQEDAIVDATHPPLRPLIATAEDLADDVPDTPLPEELEDTIQQLRDRVHPTAEHEPHPPPSEAAFHDEQSSGPVCTDGQLTIEDDPTTLDGYVRFDARLQANAGNDMILPSTPQPPGVHPNDPTVLDGILPTMREDAQPTAWRPDAYSLRAQLNAVLDANGNERLDPCRDQNTRGPADPCLWNALWDAYNPACQDAEGDGCGEVLERDGYDTDAGVGVYAVINITGPTLVYDADPQSGATMQNRTLPIGFQDPSAQNCIVATSTGFETKLAQHHGVPVAELPQTLCPDVDGERALVLDAFRDQTADPARAGATVERGDISLAIAWTPLAPTPDAIQQTLDLGSTDEACLHAIFNVQEDQAAADTEGNFTLEGFNAFSRCLAL